MLRCQLKPNENRVLDDMFCKRKKISPKQIR
jgi:hypothetical protein